MHRALILVPALALVAGCYNEKNTRFTLGDDIRFSVVDPAAEASYVEAPQTEPLDIYRRGWERYSFVVPVDGTDHHYLGRTDLPCTDSTARQRREFPTPDTATELSGDSEGRQFYESVEAPFWAAWDCLLLIPRLIGWHIANDGQAVSPDVNYDRYPDRKLDAEQRALWLGEP